MFRLVTHLGSLPNRKPFALVHLASWRPRFSLAATSRSLFSAMARASLAAPAVARPLAGARARGVPRRALRVRAVSSPSSVDVAAPASVANPLAGVELFDVNGEAKAVPFWSEDQTVVVTFLRHFG